MQVFEQSILDWIQLHLRCEFLDALAIVLSYLGAHGEIWILLTVCLLLSRRHRRAGLAVAVALILDVICCNLALKPLVGRIRPCDVNAAIALLVPRPGDASFPSGHTASSFAAALALADAGDRLWIPALALAFAMGLSRLYLYVHWPSDVLGGALLGALLGIAGSRLSRRMLRARRIDR